VSGLQASLPWAKVAFEYFGFLAHFAIYGALSFRFLVLPRVSSLDGDAGVRAAAERRAAGIGIAGGLLLVANVLGWAARNAAAQHRSILAYLLHAKPAFLAQLLCGLVAVVACAAAARRPSGGWLVALLAGIVLSTRNLLTLDWSAFLNSLHEISAALWLATLFLVVTAALPAILSGQTAEARRGPLVADLVARFSPLALSAAILTGLTGLANSYVHVKYVDALWTTTYGCVLSVKLAVVVLVVAAGAWNWRRMLPRLGTEDAAHALRRSSTVELTFAMVVLVLTAVLLGLPEPELPAR
jgi:putative copper export protein